MSESVNKNLRNIAIIAHVDHGKTTLVDQMLKQAGLFREDKVMADRVMDNMDLERERGITIAAKNCSIMYGDVKINILDTPGHADFGGEVERSLQMVDGAIILVDASEGPLPQTRFVAGKALARGIPIIALINKIDRKDAEPERVLSSLYDLLIDLDADESQLEFPVLYAIGRDGIAKNSLSDESTTLQPLFEAIVKHLPPPKFDLEEPFQMLVANIGYSDYVGRLAIGKVFHGEAKKNDALVCLKAEDKMIPLKVSKVQVYEGIGFKEVDVVSPGDIIILAGIEDVEIGDTIATKMAPRRLPRIHVDEPTVSMKFTVNTSPLAGKEGKYVQGVRLKERLYKETLHNVALKIEDTDVADTWIVKGRGEFQMAILIEMMRREGYELAVGRPQVIYKIENGIKKEPIEHLVIDCDETSLGVVTEKLGRRKGTMTTMVNHGTGRVRMEFTIPSRSLIGYRNEFLTDTRGTGIMSSYLAGYEEFRGEIQSRLTGSLVSDRAGEAVTYGLFHLEPRGKLLITGGTVVYEGMIIGEHNRDNDLNVNPCKAKKLSNMRAAGKDENVVLTAISPLTLEKAIEFIRDDELVEVTPQSIRLRKTVLSATFRS